jgi:polyhydroxyalkanoate synthase
MTKTTSGKNDGPEPAPQSPGMPAHGTEAAFSDGAPILTEMVRDIAQVATAMAKDPAALVRLQVDYWRDHLELLNYLVAGAAGQPARPVVAPAPDDRRFRDSEWNSNPLFDGTKQSYLLTVGHANSILEGLQGLDGDSRRRIEFHLRQMSDALSPTNFAMTNPEVMRTTLKSGGANLVRGAKILSDDIVRGGGRLTPELSDRSAFEVGRNLATTPGKVIFQNDVMQLIQYEPSTEQVRQRPLLIIPSWINKFYILDLSENNSFVRWLVNEGYTVFIISWINPDRRHGRMTFSDYMSLGPLTALDQIANATGEKSVNAVGYCIGGTLLATTLAVMAARGDNRITSATYLATLVDFSEPGDMAVFTSDAHLATLEQEMETRGYLDARVMADTFSMLRANDLIWSASIKSYLLGKDPVPFDLLFWNSDATRMPGDLHTFYLRNMYRGNRLVEPGGIEVAGVPVDLRKIETPAFILSTREDHIAPWRSTYAATQIYGGETKFVLAGSGHVAGVVNPANSNKYGYWTNGALPDSPDQWLEGASTNAGSWWPYWQNWLAGHSGDWVFARKPGDHRSEVIEDAPGGYVKVTY